MYTDKIQNILLSNLSLKQVYVIPFEKHYQIIVIDEILSTKTKLEQHKTIYAPLHEYIVKQIVHSISIYVFSPKDWNNQRHLYKL